MDNAALEAVEPSFKKQQELILSTFSKSSETFDQVMKTCSAFVRSDQLEPFFRKHCPFFSKSAFVAFWSHFSDVFINQQVQSCFEGRCNKKIKKSCIHKDKINHLLQQISKCFDDQILDLLVNTNFFAVVNLDKQSWRFNPIFSCLIVSQQFSLADKLIGKLQPYKRMSFLRKLCPLLYDAFSIEFFKWVCRNEFLNLTWCETSSSNPFFRKKKEQNEKTKLYLDQIFRTIVTNQQIDTFAALVHFLVVCESTTTLHSEIRDLILYWWVRLDAPSLPTSDIFRDFCIQYHDHLGKKKQELFDCNLRQQHWIFSVWKTRKQYLQLLAGFCCLEETCSFVPNALFQMIPWFPSDLEMNELYEWFLLRQNIQLFCFHPNKNRAIDYINTVISLYTIPDVCRVCGCIQPSFFVFRCNDLICSACVEQIKLQRIVEHCLKTGASLQGTEHVDFQCPCCRQFVVSFQSFLVH